MPNGNSAFYCDAALNFKNIASIHNINIKWDSDWFDSNLFNTISWKGYLWYLLINIRVIFKPCIKHLL